MVDRERIISLLEDFREWKSDVENSVEIIKRFKDKKIEKILLHSIKAYFLDFHRVCEDYISISLKELNKYRVGISAIEGMEILKDSSFVSEEFLDFYTKSRRLRNRLAHRYKVPTDEVLLENLKNNEKIINELELKIKELLK